MLPMLIDPVLLSERRYDGFDQVSAKAFVQDMRGPGSLVVQRRAVHEPHNAGALGCFGGKVKPRETPPMALRRELGQELPGFKILGLYPIRMIGTMKEGRYRVVFYFRALGRLDSLICGEGVPELFKDAADLMAEPTLGHSPRLALATAVHRGLIAWPKGRSRLPAMVPGGCGQLVS